MQKCSWCINTMHRTLWIYFIFQKFYNEKKQKPNALHKPFSSFNKTDEAKLPWPHCIFISYKPHWTRSNCWSCKLNQWLLLATQIWWRPFDFLRFFRICTISHGILDGMLWIERFSLHLKFVYDFKMKWK